MNQITVFSRNNCMQCKMVKKFLEEHDIDFREVNIDDKPEIREQLISEGFMSVPVVKSQKITFTGFRPAELKKIVA